MRPFIKLIPKSPSARSLSWNYVFGLRSYGFELGCVSWYKKTIGGTPTLIINSVACQVSKASEKSKEKFLSYIKISVILMFLPWLRQEYLFKTKLSP